MHPHTIQWEPDEAARAARAKGKEWVREILVLPPETLVTWVETICPDPNCPIVETVILVHENDSAPAREFRFARPKAALTKAHVQQALQAK